MRTLLEQRRRGGVASSLLIVISKLRFAVFWSTSRVVPVVGPIRHTTSSVSLPSNSKKQMIPPTSPWRRAEDIVNIARLKAYKRVAGTQEDVCRSKINVPMIESVIKIIPLSTPFTSALKRRSDELEFDEGSLPL
jgi:hypothetical protein